MIKALGGFSPVIISATPIPEGTISGYQINGIIEVIKLTDFKGDTWNLMYTRPSRYLHKGDAYWKVWYIASIRPNELKNYEEVPLPIFTEWWPHIWG